MDELSLLVGKKLGRVGVVVDEPVCADGHDDGCETFLYHGGMFEHKHNRISG